MSCLPSPQDGTRRSSLPQRLRKGPVDHVGKRHETAQGGPRSNALCLCLRTARILTRRESFDKPCLGGTTATLHRSRSFRGRQRGPDPSTGDRGRGLSDRRRSISRSPRDSACGASSAGGLSLVNGHESVSLKACRRVCNRTADSRGVRWGVCSICLIPPGREDGWGEAAPRRRFRRARSLQSAD